MEENLSTKGHLFSIRTFLLIACILSFVLFATSVLRWMPRVTHGFAMYYAYSRMLLEGEEFSRAYDYEYFNAKIREYGITGISDIANNIPTNALALLPVASLSPAAAKIAWGIASLIAYALSIWILYRLYDIRLSSNIGLALLTLVFLWRPALENIALGQMYALLLLLFSLSLAGVSHRSSMMASLPIGFSLLVKGYGVVPTMWFAVNRQWKSLLVVLGLTLAVIIGTLPFFGVNSWIGFSGVLASLGTLPTDGHVAFQTINGFLLRLFSYDARWLPNPVFIVPTLYLRTLSYLLNLSLIAYVLRKGRHSGSRQRLIDFSAAIATGVITAPLAEEYHFMLFLPLVLGLCVRLHSGFVESRKLMVPDWVYLAAVIIMAAPLPYKLLHFAPFPLIVLAYPKLYSGFVVLWYFSRRDRKNGHE